MRIHLTASLLIIATGAQAATDVERFAEGRVALDKFKDCPAALSALEAVDPGGSLAQDPIYIYYVARAYECIGNRQSALDWYTKYSERVPPTAEITDKIGELRYLEQKELKKRADELEREREQARVQELQRLTGVYQRQVSEGKVSFEKRQYSQAIEAFKRASSTLPDEQEPFLYLARAYAAQDMISLALEALNNAGRSRPVGASYFESPEFAYLVADTGFATFLREKLSSPGDRGPQRIRERLMAGLYFPSFRLNSSSNDKFIFWLNQSLSVNGATCVAQIKIDDHFQRNATDRIKEINQQLTLPLARVANISSEIVGGPSEATTANPYHENQPALPSRWIARLTAEGDDLAFTIIRRDYDRQYGFFSYYDPETHEATSRVPSVSIYLALDDANARAALRNLQAMVSICRSLGPI